MSLNGTLRQMKEASLSRIPPAAAVIMGRVKKELEDSGIVNNALAPGDTAPDFALKDWQGQHFSSKEILAKGPMVLTVYRGSW